MTNGKIEQLSDNELDAVNGGAIPVAAWVAIKVGVVLIAAAKGAYDAHQKKALRSD